MEKGCTVTLLVVLFDVQQGFGVCITLKAAFAMNTRTYTGVWCCAYRYAHKPFLRIAYNALNS